MNFSLITLGELLSSQNEITKRNAFSILKQLQKERDEHTHKHYGKVHIEECAYCRLDNGEPFILD